MNENDIGNLLMNMSAGLLPEHLSSQEISILEKNMVSIGFIY